MSNTSVTEQNRDRELTLEINVGDRTFDFNNQKLKMMPEENPEFIRGYWKQDKEGKKFIKKAVLGDTVYFHFSTRGLIDGRKVSLKLYDRDFYMGLDWMDKDDQQFPVREIIKTAKIKNNKGFVELYLDESWEGLIAEDKNFLGFSNEKIELYWEVTYKSKFTTILPKSIDHYLKVGQNDRTLYIKPFSYDHNMPEFFDYDGNPLAHLQIGTNHSIDPQLKNDVEKQHAAEVAIHGRDILRDQAISSGTDALGKKISNIALARFERATFAAKNTPYTANIFNDIYTQDPKIIKELREYDFKKVIKNNGVKSLEFYGKSGTKMKVLGFMKKTGSGAGTVIDLFDMFKFATGSGLDFENPLSFPGVGALGPIGAAFSLLNGVAGMMVKQLKDELDANLSDHIQRQINKAKLKGLDATRDVMNSWHTKVNNWDIISLNEMTVNKILNGEYKSLSDVRYDDSQILDDFDKNVTLLYRTHNNQNKGMYIDIIESIFIKV